MLNPSLLKKYKKIMPQKLSIVSSMETQLQRINYNLSENYCQFHINDCQKKIYGDYYVLQMYVLPLVGQFKGIQFKPKAFFSISNIVRRPIIYNNYRIFHPNIDIYTCEIVFQEIATNWNPALSLIHLLNSMKDVIIRPNVNLVPDNELNRRAAWNFHYNKMQFKNLLLANHPNVLQQRINQQFNDLLISKMINLYMEDEDYKIGDKEKLFWSLPVAKAKEFHKYNRKEDERDWFNSKKMNDAVFQLVQLPIIQNYLKGSMTPNQSIVHCNL